MKLPLAGMASAQVSGTTGKNLLQLFNYSGVRLLDGRLRDQCLATRDVFKGIPTDNLLVGFRQRAKLAAPGTPLQGWYGGDVFNAFGQYVSGMARLSKSLGDPALGAKTRELMAGWSKTIEPDGYFYYSRRPIPPHYIYDKMMFGLVDVLEYLGWEEAVPLMERLTDWASANLDRRRMRALENGATYDGNGEWYTLAENLYRAYQLTGNPKFHSFAQVWHYPAYWDMFTGTEPPSPIGFHAYSHVNTLSSAAMAYAVSGDSHYRTVITNAFDWLEQTQMFATGGYGPDEKLLAPDGSLGKSLESTYNTFETVCGSWAGFKLGRYLMQFTGEAKYGDWIEKLVYNGVGAALPLRPDGSNYYYSEYHVDGGRKGYHPAKWTCCSGTLPQAVADYHNLIYFHDADGLYVNLYVPSEVIWRRGADEVRIRQQTSYPENETTLLEVQPARPQQYKIKFRVPRWSAGVTVEINGARVDIDARPGMWATLERTWIAGDRARIRIPMQLSYAAVDAQHPSRVAVTYGPVVLVREDSAALIADSRNLSRSVRRDGEELQFHMETRTSSRFVPFYKAGFGSLYQMYLDRV